MTATFFLIPLKRFLISQMWYFRSPPDSESQNTKKYQVLNITLHTSHIKYCIRIGLFKKIIIVKIVIPFNNLLKLILNNFAKCVFFMKIITLTLKRKYFGKVRPYHCELSTASWFS